MKTFLWVTGWVCLLFSSAAGAVGPFGQHFPQGAAAVDFIYGPNGMWRDQTGLEYRWGFNEQCATPAHTHDATALLVYGATHNVTAPDSTCVLFGDENGNGEIADDAPQGFAFHEHSGLGRGGAPLASPFHQFWFDDNWLAEYVADAYARPRPAGLQDRGQTTRWRLLAGDDSHWAPYATAQYVDQLALNGLYALNAGDVGSALANWNSILAVSGATYDWSQQRYEYPGIAETYHLALWAMLSERLLNERSGFPQRPTILQHAMSLHSQLLSLQETDPQGRRLGWVTSIGDPQSLMNTETTSLAVLALATDATWVLEPGYEPLRSLERNYFLRPHNVLSAVVGLSQPGHVVYGPYWNLQPGDYVVEFSLRTPANAVASRDNRLATLDVYDGKSILSLADVPVTTMPGDNQWQRYRLLVSIANPSNATEFRVYWHGLFNLDVGPIRVTKVDPGAVAAAMMLRLRQGLTPITKAYPLNSVDSGRDGGRR